ncbi:MAG TPA: ATP-dependent helicase, partial [Symbiobacteriaceae bacterium]|nr:ATP-dependent helicase [Symbiobacteriaceae bacterium]
MTREFPLLTQLNPAQRRAATAGPGHLCINAAAGTGKTSTVAARILWLQLVKGVPASSILAVTFSRAARTNLLERVEAYTHILGQGSSVQTLTLHGLAFRVLRAATRTGETWLRPGFDLITSGRDRINPMLQENADALLVDLTDKWDLPTRVEQYSLALEAVRQGCRALDRAVLRPDELPAGEIIRIPAPIQTDLLRRVWERYNRLLRSRNSIDHAGMVTEAIAALYHDGETLRRSRENLQYIIVDEYQDTSRAQEELIQLLVGEQTSVNVVGDSDQAIYTFNGADVGNIVHFGDRMADVESPLTVLPPVDLMDNYRSSPKILAAANRVLRIIHGHERKQLVPATGSLPEPVKSYRQRDYDVVRVSAPDLDAAAAWAAHEIQRLVTAEAVAPSDIAVLVRKDTAYSPQGARVREALAAIGIATENYDRDPARTARLQEAVRSLCGDPDNYGEPLSALRVRVAAGEFAGDLGEFAPDEVTALLAEAEVAGAEYAYEAAEFVYEQGAPEATPADLSGVQVRTVHSAKGLEFRVVFLMYVADRAFPHGAVPDLEEERRLYYVGLTRAQERLYVLGRKGIRSDSFFDEIAGAGVTTVQAG